MASFEVIRRTLTCPVCGDSVDFEISYQAQILRYSLGASSVPVELTASPPRLLGEMCEHMRPKWAIAVARWGSKEAV